ncbi:class II aldolase/adducin family protein [Butyrivibrio sp. YAB3001]|uniref:class II aldolase/adducin family protein n=1 Tax=Butyrivibrio sp. YAB3001 TaxID=1520812 RepID=UPI0008F64B75|nr:class II aldolase/adducin family protein [Butyrivibrio sp. YAB3001]SFB66499.1 L-fuculose-phosphate aldolase [Butyrivibrio sp. YAB3001]
MITDEKELLLAKKKIIEVSRVLQDVGLLVRTWGNLSQRIDENYFLITPSGIKYEDLTPEMIVKVNINDLSYEGDIVPSSEKAVHAECYRIRKDADFIVHTHQVYASCAGTLGLKKIHTYFDDEDIVIPVAAYALPGTAKLAENVGLALTKFPDSNGIIMANHGTVCMGESAKAAVFEAEKMEVACHNFLADVCKTDMNHGVEEGFSSHLENGEIVYDIPDTPARVKEIHREIYRRRPDVRYIIHNKSEAVMTVSRRASHMRPLLDDFAQLIGYSVKIPSNEHGKDGLSFHNIKKNVNAVFSLNDGAYCVGSTYDDAMAVAIVLDKGCIAYISVMRNGEGHYLSLWESIKMNRHYRKSYSKLADLKR